jgi:hypothetical protein
MYVHMHITFKLNGAPWYALHVLTPFHNTYNSLIKVGSKYTSTFLDVIDYLPGMSNANIRKECLVTNQGGKL